MTGVKQLFKITPRLDWMYTTICSTSDHIISQVKNWYPKKFCKPPWRFTTRSPQSFVDFLLQDKNRPQHSVLFNNPSRTSYEISRNVISSVLPSLPRHILVFVSYAMPHLWKHKLKLQS